MDATKYEPIDWERVHACDDPRLVMIEGFRDRPDYDGMPGYGPGGRLPKVVWLGDIDDGARCEDAEGNRFRVMGSGSMQGTVVIRDRYRRMYQADIDYLVKPTR